MTNAILREKPDAGNLYVRFDEGEVASAKPRRDSLPYKGKLLFAGVAGALTTLASGVSTSYSTYGLIEFGGNRAKSVADAVVFRGGSIDYTAFGNLKSTSPSGMYILVY